NPKLVPPEWSEVFTGKRQPRTVIIPPAGQSGGFDHVRVSFEVQGQNYTIVVLKQSFDFQADAFPSEISLYMTTMFGSKSPLVRLMAQLNHSMLDPRTAQVLKGKYSIRFEVDGFSSVDDANARAVVFGTVYGLIGTDDQRRDLLIALLWGAPVALAFGLAGALATVLIQTLLGAISGWYGGAVDELVQRTADFYLIIPTLPILILIGILYYRSLF